ncbi:MAG: hypothetical protein ACP5N2_07505 [Candidatus Nanoarchaeia archaeon]
MVKNTNAKFLVLIVIIFALAINISAQNVEVITYDSDAESTQPVPTADTVVINKYSADFLFSLGAAQQNPTVCLCSSAYDKIYITNTAPYEATFTILTNLPEYASVPYSTMRLGAGKTAELNILLSASCDAKSGEFEYNVLVSNNFGTQYTLERKLNIERCQSIQSTLYATTNEIKPCEKVNYTIELKNVAPFTEQYNVKPKSGLQFENKEYAVTLEPGQKSYLEFNYQPECGIYGDKEITFFIDSINNKLSAKLSHTLIIDRAYDFSVSNTENNNLCREEETIIPITVTNLADFDNEFYFTIVNKQDFLEAKDSYALIAPGNEAVFRVVANPTKTTKTDQVLDFEIKTKLGDLKYRGKIFLRTHDCYNLNVNILSNINPELCAGTYTYDVEVSNRGLFEETISLSDDSEYAEVSPSQIVLSPGEQKKVALLLSLPDEDVKDLTIKVTSSIDSKKGLWEDTLSIDVTKKYDCTLLEYDTQKLFARYGTENITFRVENKGTLETEYDLKLEGPNFLELETKEINLKPEESTDLMITLYADDSEVQKNYDFTIKATADNDEFYENSMTLRMADIPWLQKMYNKATSTPCTTATSILLLILILGIIAVIILAWKRVRVPLAAKIIALGLIVLIIVLVLVMKGLPESRYVPIDKTLINNSNLIWHEDKEYNLELNEYFFDPDNDTLSFVVEDMPENISVEIEGTNAKLTPDKDWSGTARIRFLARDNYGGEIVSQRINLEVVEVEEFSITNCYTNNCLFWNALLLIIILLLVFALRTRKENALMSKKVLVAGLKKQKGFLYYVDKDGDVARTPMARGNKKNQKFKKEKVARTVTIKRKR